MSLQEIVGKINCQPEMRFEWKVKNFFSLSHTLGHYYHSPDFQAWNYSFYLRLYPNGKGFEFESDNWIGVFLMLSDECCPLRVRFRLGIKTNLGETEICPSASYTFLKTDSGFGSVKALDRSELLQRKDELVPSGILTIIATLETNLPGILEGGQKVLHDMETMWQTGENSDVVIQVKGVEFRAHKVILAARTPVLSAMFKHDTAEKISGTVTINDCEPTVFEEFLNYIYTGGPRELTTQNCIALYIVAEKYLADDLKSQCLQYIRNSLCIETFCGAVILAVSHNEVELLDDVTDFATENIRPIIRSVQWQNLIQEHPTVANEVLIKALGP